MTQVKSSVPLRKYVGKSALILFLISIIYLSISLISGFHYNCSDSYLVLDQIYKIQDSGLLYYIVNMLAVVFNISIIAYFVSLRGYYRKYNHYYADLAFIFIPVFGIGILLSDLVQLLFIPFFLKHSCQLYSESSIQIIISNLINSCNGSFMQFVSAFSYSILGISAVINGFQMFYRTSKLQLSGALLTISGLLFSFGIVGYLFNDMSILELQLFGMMLLTVSTLPISLKYLKGKEFGNGTSSSRS